MSRDDAQGKKRDDAQRKRDDAHGKKRDDAHGKKRDDAQGGRVKVRRAELRMVGLPLVRPFRTSFGTSTEKVCVLARVETDDAEGWGECVADVEPGFSEEFNDGAWQVLRDFLVPALFAAGDVTMDDLEDVFAFVRGNPMAKATLINACIDAGLRARGQSLASYLGAERTQVECGVSVGISATTEELVHQVAGYLSEGYRRIKLKIEPGLDVERVRAVREANPEIALSVDANAAYRLSDVDVFRALDAFDLLMVEQPLHHDDLVRHADLQAQIATDVCLDESIRSVDRAQDALRLGSCRIMLEICWVLTGSRLAWNTARGAGGRPCTGCSPSVRRLPTSHGNTPAKSGQTTCTAADTEP